MRHRRLTTRLHHCRTALLLAGIRAGGRRSVAFQRRCQPCCIVEGMRNSTSSQTSPPGGSALISETTSMAYSILCGGCYAVPATINRSSRTLLILIS